MAGCTISGIEIRASYIHCFAQAGDSKLNLMDYEVSEEYMHKNSLHLIRPEYLPGCLYR